uniref:KH domain-containing protein n=1 Tax=Strongyloides stercoralis TaxID=6248 RepID=A0A0K0DVW6_STRER
MEIYPPFEIIGMKDDKNHQKNLDNFILPKKKLITSLDSKVDSTAFQKENGTRNVTLDYMVALLKEKKQLLMFQEHFPNVINLLDEEVSRVRMSLFQCDFSNISLQLPEPQGNIVLAQKKVYVPVDKYPEFNFVGRILGPRGMTAKQLEQETDCKIMVRGKGSLRDKKKEETFKGKPNWEHLDDDLHVLIQCEDTQNRAEIKINNAISQVDKLLIPAPEGSDELKRKQLMELAIINGTYRSSTGSKYPFSGSKPSPLQLNINNYSSSNDNESSSRSMSCGYYPGSPLLPQSSYGISQPMSAGFVERGVFSPPLSPFDIKTPNFDSLLNGVDFSKISKLFSCGTPPITSEAFSFPSNFTSPVALNDITNKELSNKYTSLESSKSTPKSKDILSSSC